MLNVSAETPRISLPARELKIPMLEQRYAVVQNAASDRTIYPELPAQALISSIEARRENLVHSPSRSRPLEARDTYRQNSALLSARENEVRR